MLLRQCSGSWLMLPSGHPQSILAWLDPGDFSLHSKLCLIWLHSAAKEAHGLTHTHPAHSCHSPYFTTVASKPQTWGPSIQLSDQSYHSSTKHSHCLLGPLTFYTFLECRKLSVLVVALECSKSWHGWALLKQGLSSAQLSHSSLPSILSCSIPFISVRAFITSLKIYLWVG